MTKATSEQILQTLLEYYVIAVRDEQKKYDAGLTTEDLYGVINNGIGALTVSKDLHDAIVDRLTKEKIFRQEMYQHKMRIRINPDIIGKEGNISNVAS